MIVTLTLAAGGVKVAPASYLGREVFNAYRAACDSAGAIYKADIRGQVAPLDAIPALLEALRGAQFEPRMAPDVAAALKARAEAIQADQGGAAGRLEAVRARLATQNLALYPFQEIGAAWLAPRLRGLLIDEMGLGKTPQALIAAPEGAPVLVVCPASLKGNWSREAARWRPDLQVTILAGRGSFRWPAQGELVVINYDILPPDLKEIKATLAEGDLFTLPPRAEPAPGTVIIADECHAIKGPKTLRTQRLRAMFKAAWAAGGRAWGLTGTPLMNRQEELGSLLQSFGLFEEAFGSWPRYLRMMSAKKLHWGGFSWGKPSAAAIEGLRKVMLRRSRIEVLPDLPTKTRQSIPVDIDNAAKTVLAAAAAAIEEAGIDLQAVIEEQKSLGAAFEVIAKARKALATAKIPAMLGIIEEYEEEEELLIVFSAHRPPIDILKARPGWAVITGDTPNEERGRIVEDFQAGKLKGVGLTIKAGGVGFTLTHSHHALFVDLEWTPAANSQAEDRICRIGQEKGCIIKVLVAPDTLDELVADLLRAKQEIIEKTVEAARVAPAATNDNRDAAKLLEAAASQALPPAPPKPTVNPRRPPASPQEEWAGRALVQLCQQDPDGAAEQNGVGFNKFDGDFGHKMGREHQTHGGLTAGQWRAVIAMCRKYRGQVGTCPE